MIKPISPDDVEHELPDEVIDAFNTLIARHWNGKKAIVYQKVVAQAIHSNFLSNNKEITVDQVFENNYLDIEDVYKKQGWDVKYDKPGWDENYEAHFTFTKSI